ncbi:hypothetical protein F442_15420 [Phytophthora nicotianae P10297]|uniref:Uncharacterized protein n=4 Tax=Phytophthora nicotianae TaxID=4792 RepID=W2R432_PHYN3|nr:hypothetical protein PPTG_21443 [Phytophthora nicotianae INRA-310]ETI38742.1 hypothetical protein F443_15588 [Phytophthora nicotianae P1569]ETK78958.1 hypothetical protein L915_15132 [Phytophthora nicotianae]ETP36695.1 hypothetical protein F442_15420 [Phytophthora nicotianae P10297]KUF80370.1 hypothetical protein AM587_10015644 [Phytophthora nicotianae]ETM38785.1 hypothetical protein L914_14990 [Phytophthora nicotianae]
MAAVHVVTPLAEWSLNNAADHLSGLTAVLSRNHGKLRRYTKLDEKLRQLDLCVIAFWFTYANRSHTDEGLSNGVSPKNMGVVSLSLESPPKPTLPAQAPNTRAHCSDTTKQQQQHPFATKS